MEDVVRFGDSDRLVGIASTPTDVGSDIGVVLLNAGLVHRVGPNRIYVTLARRLCSRGFHALRFDYSGIGDSPPRADAAHFAESSVLEAEAAMDWLARERGCRRFVLLGLCSGTLAAFRTAIQSPRVIALVLLTSLLEEPESVDQAKIDEAMDRRNARSYAKVKALDWSSWRRFLTGRANYRHVMEVVGRNLRRRIGKVPRESRLSSPVLEQIDRLCQRGLFVHFIYGEPTTVLEYFRMTLEPGLRKHVDDGSVRVTVIEKSDHTFTSLSDQRRLGDVIEGWLDDKLSREPGAAAEVSAPPEPAVHRT